LARDTGVDAELLSELSLFALAQASRWRQLPPLRSSLNAIGQLLQRRDRRLEQTLFGCCFANPVGLAAGFDKNAVAAGLWHQFGFGFAELGSVTALAQPGNPRPRLFRLAAEQAALNRMGFNNRGATAVRGILEAQQLPPPGQRPLVLGLNIGKSKLAPLDQAAADYSACLAELVPLADYVVINVSSPNTPGLRQLQDATLLSQLLQELQAQSACPPLMVKIAPDLEDGAIDAVAKLALDLGLAAVIATNTSLDRLGLGERRLAQTGLSLAQEAGGLSGAPLRPRALAVLRRLRATAGPQLPLIGVGGIDSPEAAWERLAAGACLLQLYTGWIYQGPQLVPRILDGLLAQLQLHGLPNLAAAVGSELPWQDPFPSVSAFPPGKTP
jgi:dihydroorotate dehydrogenase